MTLVKLTKGGSTTVSGVLDFIIPSGNYHKTSSMRVEYTHTGAGAGITVYARNDACPVFSTCNVILDGE